MGSKVVVVDTFQKNISNQYRAVFREEQVVEYNILFKNTQNNVLDSELCLARTVCKLVGKEDCLNKQFIRAIGKEDCSFQESYQVQQWKTPLDYHLEKLDLMTEKSKIAFSEQLMSFKIRSTQLVKVQPDHLVNVEVKIDTFCGDILSHIVPKHVSPIILKDFQDACSVRFSKFSFLELPDLQVVLKYLETFEVQSCFIVAPYLLSIVTLPMLFMCWYSMNLNHFFKNLFGSTVLRITGSPFSSMDYLSHPTFRKILTYSSLGALGVGSTYAFRSFFLQSIFPAKLAPVELLPSVPIDPLECYRFTGTAGEIIRLFQTTTGGYLVVFLDTINGYRDIAFKIYVEPWVELALKCIEKAK